MPRIAESRPPAEPSSPEQRARHLRILRAAAHFGAEKGLERVQMHEVAKAAGVAIGTLYRYFPSKTHLFTAVMAEQMDRLDETSPQAPADGDPVEAVAELLVSASRRLLVKPALASAMLQSANSANAAMVTDAGRIDERCRALLLRTLGLETPTAQDVTLVRLLIQCWYGVLQSALNGRVSMPDAENDIRLACRLLLVSRSNAED
ncbi:TetR family transcriptional regulator [Nocardiopsis sp. HNM0947]|uniref:TetR family transcriptional regulator n=1 Tax=Nocardiopsis coralli TaxID=2772213 RepID=A0ABR9NZR8_9ACTN|nr:TetR family transcriptional regulator [Nocardiopsis coralli]MBE2997087.1 TetR family transcriptional regulator [Nocardiopsis coralli]